MDGEHRMRHYPLPPGGVIEGEPVAVALSAPISDQSRLLTSQ